jgi:glyoxalase/bleomycin resistance protein/dioxygenase superfamily protein
VDDVDALHAELFGKDALILRAPEDKPWGRREMAVATPDGNRMMLGQPIRCSPGPGVAGGPEPRHINH